MKLSLKLSIGLLMCILLSGTTHCAYSQSVKHRTERPFIWADQQDRASILGKIESQTWAKAYFNDMKLRVQKELRAYEKDIDAYLRKLPFDPKSSQNGTHPYFQHQSGSKNIGTTLLYLQCATDCATIYYLTQEDRYAQYAVDILNTFVLGLTNTPISKARSTSTGWIYPKDALRELRYMASLPVIYDFCAPYIKQGATAYDISKSARAPFEYDKSQKVFETYIKIALEQGIIGCNWPVLESPCMVQCALALDDVKLRDKYIDNYLNTDTPNQESLRTVAARYKYIGDIHPESSNYSTEVSNLSTILMYIMTRYDPSLHLAQKYPAIPWSISRWNELKFPNGEIPRVGDGKRKADVQIQQYEFPYAIGKLDNVPSLNVKFGALINDARQKNQYNRPRIAPYTNSVHLYYDPAYLLWAAAEISEPAQEFVLPRTDQLSHAGMLIQRNLSNDQNPENGLMAMVSGAHYVHAHASGMDMELYGKGEVLGAEGGCGEYLSDLHENYLRMFAAHNTVIVNGNSSTEGGWINLGMNTVEKVAMEPEQQSEALSPYYSYTRTSFIDDKGDKAEAVQQRTISVIRTSPTTGYYVDIFKSKSSLPNEFHDYVYHNIADEVIINNSDLALNSEPKRYMANADVEFIVNKQFRHPGWHYFKDVMSSAKYTGNVHGIFKAHSANGNALNMRFFVGGAQEREYTTVMAPPTREAPKGYANKPTPTIVIRRTGEAWDTPFAVIYEPTKGTENGGSVESVENITENGKFKGLKVVSKTESGIITQYIIHQQKDEIFTDPKLGMSFEGGFAIITLDSRSNLRHIYAGEMKSLKYKKSFVASKNSDFADAYIDFTTSKPTVKSSRPLTYNNL